MCHHSANPRRALASCGAKGLPPCHLRSHLALARLTQERVEAREVLPVRFRPEVRLRLRESLSLRARCVARHRWDFVEYVRFEGINISHLF